MGSAMNVRYVTCTHVVAKILSGKINIMEDIPDMQSQP